MDPEIAEHFARIARQARLYLQNVEIMTDATPDRAILRLTAQRGPLRIIVTELSTDGERKYNYYALQGDYVLAGFDNSADPGAIRLKYGRIGSAHANELVPHLHTENKQRLELTDDFGFDSFLEWLRQNVPTT